MYNVYMLGVWNIYKSFALGTYTDHGFLYLKMAFLLVLFPGPDFPLSPRFMLDLFMVVTDCVEPSTYSFLCDPLGLHRAR